MEEMIVTAKMSDTASAEDSSPSIVRFSSRNASSKYDFVKVKVWLGDNADHYYVLSRFLLSRMLTVTKSWEGGNDYVKQTHKAKLLYAM